MRVSARNCTSLGSECSPNFFRIVSKGSLGRRNAVGVQFYGRARCGGRVDAAMDVESCKPGVRGSTANIWKSRTAMDQEAVFRCLWRPERGPSRFVKSPYNKIPSPFDFRRHLRVEPFPVSPWTSQGRDKSTVRGVDRCGAAADENLARSSAIFPKQHQDLTLKDWSVGRVFRLRTSGVRQRVSPNLPALHGQIDLASPLAATPTWTDSHDM